MTPQQAWQPEEEEEEEEGVEEEGEEGVVPVDPWPVEVPCSSG